MAFSIVGGRTPPSAREIGYFLQASLVETPVDQALRELREFFDIANVTSDGEVRYQLRGWADTRPVRSLAPISRRLRAETLTAGCCEMCGKTPMRDGVVLSVELKFPPEWGGTNDRINLWALCEECSQGRREFLEAYTPYAERISRAIAFDEPHRRIGELLKAFDGQPTPSDLIGIVANAKAYQEDFQRRIRELRSLGWVIKVSRRYNEGARVRVYYRLLWYEPWPENIHAAIKAVEKRRKESRQP